MKWTFKDKNLQQLHHLKLLKLKIYILGKFQCTSLINSSFHNVLFYFYFYFYITLTYFLNPHFSFFWSDKHSVVISKIHYKSIRFIQKNYNDSY